MQIFVRSVASTFSVTLEEGATLKDLKEEIENVEFIPSSLQNLGLEDGYLTLSDLDTVTLTMAVDGGMRAKWRKKRMRRLRRKRRKMRMRAK
jgi:hypothetical protein